MNRRINYKRCYCSRVVYLTLHDWSGTRERRGEKNIKKREKNLMTQHSRTSPTLMLPIFFYSHPFLKFYG